MKFAAVNYAADKSRIAMQSLFAATARSCPDLMGVILGSEANMPYFIGGEMSGLPPVAMKHEMSLTEEERAGKQLLIARIRTRKGEHLCTMRS